ncbi:MAG: DnaA N-terminal domain-containing protein, partial [Chloroflexota bacterium]
PRSTAVLQDSRFLDQARQRLGQVGDQTTWLDILRNLAESMTRANYTRWFARSIAVEDDAGLLIVVADPLQRDWLSRRLGALVRREAEAGGERRAIRFAALEDLGGA